MASDLDFSPPEVPEPTFLENLLRYGLFLGAIFQLICVLAIIKLRHWQALHPPLHDHHAEQTPSPEAATFSGSLWSGILDVIRSPYLLGICGFLFCYSLLSTMLYFQQAELVPKAVSNSADRTQLLASMDLLVNVVTLLIQLLAFNKLITKLGTRALLIALPMASLLGYTALAAMPMMTTLIALGVVRRAGEYAISKPARETLFNVLPAEQKYRAKNVIDTLVHRTGDTSSAWLINGLQSVGLGANSLLWLAVPISGIWLWVAWLLGGQAQRLEAIQTSVAKRS